MQTQVHVELNDDTPVYYSNYVEVSCSPLDFGLSFCRMPTKLAGLVLEQVKETGEMSLDAMVHVVVPPALIDRLVAALIKQKGEYDSIQSDNTKEAL